MKSISGDCITRYILEFLRATELGEKDFIYMWNMEAIAVITTERNVAAVHYHTLRPPCKLKKKKKKTRKKKKKEEAEANK